jgi:hypothetical protein
MNGTWIEKLIFFIMVISAIAFGWFAFVKEVSAQESANEVLKACLEMHGYTPEKFETHDFNKSSGCFQNWRTKRDKEELAELRDFLKHNPRYRYPGQSNNKCFGKPREMPFESAYIEKTENGFRAGVNYKDTLPAGCFETAPWDNRDADN